MAKNMKTVKFGASGETYYVNDYPVKVSGELTENATSIDFGTFDDGLTDVRLIVEGVEGGSGDYFHVTINGTKSTFITLGDIYKTFVHIDIKKIGPMWSVWNSANSANIVTHTRTVLKAVDTITSLSVQSYDSNKQFLAGTKYYLEGR